MRNSLGITMHFEYLSGHKYLKRYEQNKIQQKVEWRISKLQLLESEIKVDALTQQRILRMPISISEWGQLGEKRYAAITVSEGLVNRENLCCLKSCDSEKLQR
jgi:hypothetical protein